MLAGKLDRFAIEAKAEENTDGWMLGRFRIWLNGEAIGNWEDWVDLNGCVRWLRDFEQNPRDRFDARLENLDSVSVFELLVDPVFGPCAIANPDDQPIPNAFARFHLSHIGMSSFEQVDLLLIKTADDRERCLWRRHGESNIAELILDPGEMEKVAREFCDGFDSLR